MALSTYNGTLRPQIRLIDGGAEIDWINPTTREVVWSETCKPKNGMGFASQIECTGDFVVRDGYFIDADGKRHYVIQADIGQLGAILP